MNGNHCLRCDVHAEEVHDNCWASIPDGLCRGCLHESRLDLILVVDFTPINRNKNNTLIQVVANRAFSGEALGQFCVPVNSAHFLSVIVTALRIVCGILLSSNYPATRTTSDGRSRGHRDFGSLLGVNPSLDDKQLEWASRGMRSPMTSP
jgi:hypothetical protein